VLGYFPELEISVAVMVNTDRTTANALELFGLVALEAVDKDLPKLDNMTITIDSLGRFTGDFYRPTDSEDKHMQITNYDNDPFLYRKLSNSDTRGERLFYMGDNAFAPESELLDRLIFKFDEDGKVIHFKDYYNGLFINIRIKK
jgi:hypothetical protein